MEEDTSVETTEDVVIDAIIIVGTTAGIAITDNAVESEDTDVGGLTDVLQEESELLEEFGEHNGFTKEEQDGMSEELLNGELVGLIDGSTELHIELHGDGSGHGLTEEHTEMLDVIELFIITNGELVITGLMHGDLAMFGEQEDVSDGSLDIVESLVIDGHTDGFIDGFTEELSELEELEDGNGELETSEEYTIEELEDQELFIKEEFTLLLLIELLSETEFVDLEDQNWFGELVGQEDGSHSKEQKLSFVTDSKNTKKHTSNGLQKFITEDTEDSKNSLNSDLSLVRSLDVTVDLLLDSEISGFTEEQVNGSGKISQEKLEEQKELQDTDLFIDGELVLLKKLFVDLDGYLKSKELESQHSELDSKKLLEKDSSGEQNTSKKFTTREHSKESVNTDGLLSKEEAGSGQEKLHTEQLEESDLSRNTTLEQSEDVLENTNMFGKQNVFQPDVMLKV